MRVGGGYPPGLGICFLGDQTLRLALKLLHHGSSKPTVIGWALSALGIWRAVAFSLSLLLVDGSAAFVTRGQRVVWLYLHSYPVFYSRLLHILWSFLFFLS